LLDQFGTQTLDGFDLDASSPGITAAGALLEYVHETQKSALGHITRLEPYRRGTTLIIDDTTRRSLELTQTLRDGKREGSLLAVLDETVTPMGARLLADWLSNPLTDAEAINARLDAVEELVRNPSLVGELREQLRPAYDLQRLTARIATGRANPRDLGCLARTLSLLPKLKAKLAGRSAALLARLEQELDLCPQVRSEIETSLVDDPPLSITDGGVIRGGHHAELDELRDLARGGKEWIARYQAQEVQRTGIPSLKVGSSVTTWKSPPRTSTRFRPITSASRRSRTRSGSSLPSSRSTRTRCCGPRSGPSTWSRSCFKLCGRASHRMRRVCSNRRQCWHMSTS
jgi:DNA mismatch repair protein MutS